MELTLQQKIENYNQAETAVKEHPLCFKLIIQPHHFLVMLPHSVSGVDAVRVAKNNNKSKALNLVLKKLEQLWKEDNPILFHDELKGVTQ